ncbi:carotenoid biosynthesis protein [Halobacillus sp. A5]|uniref:carotenoid biosynthesis protein n=1 Tax=Halobacillus sp. A5 TaxID=2880263 RepID=UPI0020A64EF4|nr:carotenoid biosynthesis protein [Halobacillus sp. A5]MCP3026308.1 carotenoid biosynthesis protein [Halobacillus sp. A5]
MLTGIFRFFIFWYICGIILLTFDLLPPWLEWANSVFLITGGVIAGIYFSQLYGIVKALIYSFIIVSLSIYIEHLGVETGFLFGNYYYNENFGLKIADTPVTIGFAWLLIIGCSHEISRGISLTLTGWKQVAVFIPTASLAAVTMDLILDPVAYHVQEYWIWEDTGMYYDIPFSNFAGWFILAFFFHCLPFIFKQDLSAARSIWQNRMALMFGAVILMFSILSISGGVYGAAILVILLTMIWYVLYYWRLQHDSSR